MSRAVSSKLLVGATDDGMYIVQGNPDIGYDLLKVTTEPVGHFRRSWQAVAAIAQQPVLDEGA